VTTAEKYIAAAYAVFVVALLLYVAIIALKLSRFERDVAELEELARARLAQEPDGELETARHG
jgi:hypothetical protein